MSDSNRQIIEAIQRIAGTWGKDYINVIVARVIKDSINETTLTCSVDPINDSSNVTIDNVLLSAEANDGLVQYPSANSIVLVAYGVKQQPFILMFSDIDKCRITIDQCDFFIDKNGIKLFGDNFGGLVMVQALVNKINRLENTFNLHIHSGGTISGSTGPSSLQVLPLTTQQDLENTKVKHGNI